MEPHPSTSTWAVILLAMGARLSFALATGFVTDDAFITFRYAENLANGLGFVYNSGDRVLGTTSPLWTLLLAFGVSAGLPVVAFALGLSIVASAVSAAILARIGQHSGLGLFSLLPSLAYALWPRSILAETAGMESSLFTMMVLISLWLHQKNATVASTITASIASLVRPEGVVLALLLVGWTMYHDVKTAVKAAFAAIGLCLPWLAFATWYFGSPIPSSIGGKLSLYGASAASDVWNRVAYLLALHSPVGLALSMLFVIGTYIVLRGRHGLQITAAFAVALIVGFAASPTHLFFWYLAPLQPVMLLIGCLAVLAFLQKHGTNDSRVASGFAALLIIAFGLFGNLSPVRSAANQQGQQHAIHREIGEYLRGRVQGHALVGAEDIGYIGYYSKCRILDRDGLISPEVQSFNASGNYRGVVETFRPVWLVADTASPISGFLHDHQFDSSYQQDTSFTHSGRTFLIFRIRD